MDRPCHKNFSAVINGATWNQEPFHEKQVYTDPAVFNTAQDSKPEDEVAGPIVMTLTRGKL